MLDGFEIQRGGDQCERVARFRRGRERDGGGGGEVCDGAGAVDIIARGCGGRTWDGLKRASSRVDVRYVCFIDIFDLACILALTPSVQPVMRSYI